MSSGYGKGEHTTRAHWLLLFFCKPQVIQYLQVTEIAIKGSNIMTKLSNYILPVTGLTSSCPQFINWFRHFMVQNQSCNNHSRGRENINKKISFISLSLSQETLTIYHDIWALRSKDWMYKHLQTEWQTKIWIIIHKVHFNWASHQSPGKCNFLS